MHLAQCTLFYIKCCGSLLSICPLLYLSILISVQKKKKLFPWMWHCLLHRFLWASVIFVELEFAKFVAKISNWNFLVVSFFPCWNICAEEDCLSVDFKHVNSSFAVAFILLCQKRENLMMCHQPIVPPKLPFTICKLFTILESLPLCNKTDLHRLTVLAGCSPYQTDLGLCLLHTLQSM